ncbi:MAG: hypothetical protein QOK00_1816 [Thermoleophilaceae bacterium]|nr:hypothetical protein [Thermoleophilaceae bacterium]
MSRRAKRAKREAPAREAAAGQPGPRAGGPGRGGQPAPRAGGPGRPGQPAPPERPAGAPHRSHARLPFLAQVGILVAVFAIVSLVADLAGAANLGVAFGIGQIAFAIALMVLLVKA